MYILIHTSACQTKYGHVADACCTWAYHAPTVGHPYIRAMLQDWQQLRPMLVCIHCGTRGETGHRGALSQYELNVPCPPVYRSPWICAAVADQSFM